MKIYNHLCLSNRSYLSLSAHISALSLRLFERAYENDLYENNLTFYDFWYRNNLNKTTYMVSAFN